MPWNSIRTDRTSLALCLTTYLWMHSTTKAAQLKVGVSRAQRVVWVTWFTSPFPFIFVYNAPGRFTLHVHNIPGTLYFYYLFLILSLSRLPPTLPTAFCLFLVELVCWTFVFHTYKVDFRRSNTHHVRFWQRNFIALSLSLPAYDCGGPVICAHTHLWLKVVWYALKFREFNWYFLSNIILILIFE